MTSASVLKSLSVAVVCALLLLPKIAACGDDLDNVIFEGVVADSQGAALAGARVTALHLATGSERAALTDEKGRFRILVTRSGAYLLSAEAEGFAPARREQTTAGGRLVNLYFHLSPAGLSESVDVEAAAPPVDTSRTVVGETLTRADLEALPLAGRNPLDLVFLLGGAQEPPLSTAGLADEGRGVFLRGTPEEAGSFSLTGAPATSNNITIDGLDNNDDRSARERVALNPEAVEEVQVITNQYAAEYGRASGGRVNLRTRGGANQYRGQLFAFFADEGLNANTYFRNARGLGRMPQQQLREGMALGGPLRRDRAFFFASFERLDVSDFVEVAAPVPLRPHPLFPLPAPNRRLDGESEIGLFFQEISTPESRNLAAGRFDVPVDESHSLTLRFDLARGANLRGFPGGARLPETALAQGRDADSFSLAHTFTISERAVNQLRFQTSRLLPRNRAAGDGVGAVIEEPARLVAGAFTGSDASPAFARSETRWQLQNSLSLARGDHVLKFGGDLQGLRAVFRDLFATGGLYTFESVADFFAGRAARFQQRFDTASLQRNRVTGLFAQDEWKARPGLTLSYGVRWDHESILGDRDNFGPRLSLAWDPFAGRQGGEGKTVVRAGFGIFYNRALLRTLDDFSLGRTTRIVDSNLAPGVLGEVMFPRPLTDASVIERFSVRETKFLRRINPALEIPYTVQTGLGGERQLARRLVATADYVFTRGAHLWRESNINAPVLPAGFNNFTEYLLSRDFDNRMGENGRRPISGASADVVRFDLSERVASTPGALRTVDGVRVLTLGLNAPRSSNVQAALNAIRHLRPDPSLTQVEMLESTGDSFYHGAIFGLRYEAKAGVRLRAVYTLSKLIDEGTTNTASPQDLANRRGERALSLQDQRHRIGFSGQFQVPWIGLEVAPVVSFGSSRPFNIGAGFDRNLNDISNDRPDLLAPVGRPVWRRPSGPPADDVKAVMRLAPIGSSGSLPRNFGRGPGTRAFDVRLARTFRLSEAVRVRAGVDVFNVPNATTFSFGSEFIDRDDSDFLVPRRTQRPRTVLLNMKLTF